MAPRLLKLNQLQLQTGSLVTGIHIAEHPRRRLNDLTHRIFSLPAELRFNIFRQLLVRDCKFDMTHSEPCNTPFNYASPGPSSTSEDRKYLCANCNHGPGGPGPWSQNSNCPEIYISKSPARSRWARPRTNEYVCDNCHWLRFGQYQGDPCLKSLRCLCTRHHDLSLLVVRSVAS